MDKEKKIEDFLDTFCKEGFLQSEQWRIFQENEGKKTFHFEDISKSPKGEIIFRIWANAIEHKLPIVGKYFYIPRGPIIKGQKDINLTRVENMKGFLDFLLWTARDKNIGWIRFDPRNEKDLVLIKESVQKLSKNSQIGLKKSSHDMQPKEILVMDIEKTPEELLMNMKSKTRYNIRLAEKKGVTITCLSKKANDKEKYLNEFLKLNKATASRDGIVTHADDHYRKMIASFSEDILRIYVARYVDKIIAINLVVFFGDTAIYLHGASSDENREVMAPYLLQWKQILDAKEKGLKYYDFGGVATQKNTKNKDGIRKWEGITRFKTGFSPKTEPIVFPGSYDIVVSQWKYNFYKLLQTVKIFLYKICR